jgi:hypothetical protein
MCLLIFVVVSQLIKPSPFTSLWGGFVTADFIFKIMLQSKENIPHFLSNIKITQIKSNQIKSNLYFPFHRCMDSKYIYMAHIQLG